MRPSLILITALGVCVAAFDVPVQAAAGAEFPPQVTEAEVRAIVERLELRRPRLLMGLAEISGLRERLAGDAWLRQVADLVVRDAEAMLGVAPVERTLQGRRLLDQSRRALRRLITLSMAYHLTGKQVYADRAAREMLAVSAFVDWNPSHFLDVAEMTFGMAIGYDWLYERLDETTRVTVRGAILNKGVRVPLDTQHNRWTQVRNNWGQVCHAGMVAGALAVMEEDREAAVRTVHRAIANVPHSMAAFAPKGAYPEGPGYWSYGTTYNVLLIAVLESVLGQSFGLDRAPGFDQTGAYLALMTGPSGRTFNYADGGSGRSVEPAVHWFAARYRRPGWLTGEDRPWQELRRRPVEGASSANRFLPLMLLWGRDASQVDPTDLPLHWTSGSETPISVHRSSWRDPDALFVGLKGGSPSGPHGHMDIGSFVLDAKGVRWAMDLGAESYDRIESRGMNFWSMGQESDRWRVFRQSSLSHNTLVIGNELQKASGRAEIVRFSEGAGFPHSVVDMSGVYEGQAAIVQRGVALLPGGEVLIRDRLTGLRPGVAVRWGMVTPAAPGELGGRTLELRQERATLTLRIMMPEGPVWNLIDTAAPRNEWDSPNPGTRMTVFTAVAPESGTLDLAVVASPGAASATPESKLELRPPLEWSPPPP